MLAWVLASSGVVLVSAAEVDRRLRLSLAVGGFQAQDEIESDSANVLSVVNEQGELLFRYVDPRQDSAVSGNLEIQPGTISTLALQYALSRKFLIEGSGGYTRTTVGQIDVHHLGTGVHRFAAGELTRVPLQLTGLARFRPQARFNPYVGGGFGYAIVGFEPSDELDRLSLALDSSSGQPARLFTDNRGSIILVDRTQPARQLGGATVEAEDAWEWHVAGGAEIGFGPRWALFFDLRYTDATQAFRLKFDGREALGNSVPQGRTTVGSDLANATYGPLYVFPGGLLDLDGDGVLDSGLYWVTGGELRYDGVAAQLGLRYTF